jgi:hypothetical protein
VVSQRDIVAQPLHTQPTGAPGSPSFARVRCERGQATLEWTGLVLLCALALGALGAASAAVDGVSFGGALAHRLVCAVKGGCDDGDAQLAREYGERDAELVRSLAPDIVYEPGEPSLPVDFRDCRSPTCAAADDHRELDAHRTHAGRRATVFTHVVRRGGRTYIQYWLYYPDSNSTLLASDRLWRGSPLRLLGRYPGAHPDDWESYQVRLDPDGSAWVRASSHQGYQGCKQRRCKNRWTRRTGWTRVSRGSHAGHIPMRGGRPLLPGHHLRERTSTAAGLRLVPLERLRARRRYRPLDPEIKPPWRKRVWSDPASNGT